MIQAQWETKLAKIVEETCQIGTHPATKALTKKGKTRLDPILLSTAKRCMDKQLILECFKLKENTSHSQDLHLSRDLLPAQHMSPQHSRRKESYQRVNA